MATTERDELITNHPVIGEVEFGIGEGKIPQSAHVAYFWETEKEFADGVRFLEAGLRGLDHCVIFGHEEANQAVCNILQSHGFDVKDLLAQQRITILGGDPSGEKILETICGAFQQALARGAPLIRLLGNLGWGKSGWPGDYDLFAFEAKVTAVAKEFPCVVLCMYDVAALPDLVMRCGAYGTHPLIERAGSLQENIEYIPADFFLKHLALIADTLSERRQAQAESRRANESLHLSETYLADAQRLSHTGSWAFNVTTREIVHWSQELFRIFGFDPEDGMPSFDTLMERIHLEDRAGATEVIERGVREKTDYEQDFRIVLPNGTTRYIHAIGHPVFNSAGDPVEFVGTVVDVTERKVIGEERLAHLWFLESMDRINRAIQGTNDLEQMMSDVLDAVLSIFDCDRSWLVYPCDPDAPSWKVPMEHARPEFPGAFALGLDQPMDSEVATAFQTVRASSGPVRFDPESEHALPAETAKRFSIQSVIGMAVYPTGDKPYMLGLHQCSHPRVWKPEEERLFQEIGRRLEDGLTSLLMFRNLRESERHLDEAQRLAHLGHWEHDLDTGVITWSDETYRIFGLIPQERILNVSEFPELVHPEDKQVVLQAAEDAFLGDRRYDVEYRVVSPNGEQRFVHSQGDVIRDESGRPRRMFGMVQDITQRRRADEQLRRSQAYLTEAQRLSHTGSWAWNLSTGEVFWSREIYRIFGLDPDQTSLNIELIKKLRHPEDRALAEKTLEGALRERKEFEFESRIVHSDGSIRYVRSVGRPVVNAAGALVEFVGAVMDVTEAKMKEEALRKSQADLAHVTRVATLGEMTASIAHEINQPLASVVTSASACLRWLDVQKLEEARRSTSRVIAEGHRASEIIGRIRALVKKAPPQKDWVDVNETIHEVIALVRSEIQQNGVALETELSEQVPVILADRIQLQQVILNLMMNAIEAMSGVSDGPRELLIRSSTDESEQVLISVQDSGPGIDPENLDHLFEAFHTTKPQGLGMGLAISRSIIEAHGGRLWATANAQRGAVFQFVLPVGIENVA